MEAVIAELIECNKAIEQNLDTIGGVEGFKEVSDRYYRELRCAALASLRCWAKLEGVDYV